MLSENTENSLGTSNIISIEYSNAESCSNKSNKPNNTSISTGKKVNFRHNSKSAKKQERKKYQNAKAIVGDSVVKDIYGWEVSDDNEKVPKHFSRSTAEDMTCIKPPNKRNPDCFIIHVAKNHLKSNQHPETIERNIAGVANNSKTDTNKVFQV